MTIQVEQTNVQRVFSFLAGSGVGVRKSTKEIAMATGIPEGRLNTLMRDWFNSKGIGDVHFWHIHRIAEGIRAMYWYDPNVTRMEGATPLRVYKPKAKVPKEAKARHPSASVKRAVEIAKPDPTLGAPVHGLELYAQVLVDRGSIVVGIATDGRIFKGRWMIEMP